MERKENLAKEKVEEKWEAENRKVRTFRKAVEMRTFRKYVWQYGLEIFLVWVFWLWWAVCLHSWLTVGLGGLQGLFKPPRRFQLWVPLLSLGSIVCQAGTRH